MTEAGFSAGTVEEGRFRVLSVYSTGFSSNIFSDGFERFSSLYPELILSILFGFFVSGVPTSGSSYVGL